MKVCFLVSIITFIPTIAETIYYIYYIVHMVVIAVLFLFQKCKNNLLTVTGRNVDFVQKEVNHPDILTMKIKDVKKSYKFCEVSREHTWKVNFVQEVTNIKQNILHLEASENQFSIEELDDIINFIVTS